MSRASSAPLAASSVPPTIQALAQQANTQLTPTQLRLLEKQQEHAGLQALKEASGNLLEKVEELAKMGNVMADGGEGESINQPAPFHDRWDSVLNCATYP